MTKVKNSPKIMRVAKQKSQAIFKQAKEAFIQDFESHPVSVEIQQGPSAENISGTLGGYGNLFTFIGFDQKSNPVQNVSHLIKLITKFKTIRPSKNKNSLEIIVSVPTLEDFGASTPLPWESGRSWVIGIERGISGFGSYMYEKRHGQEYSRSGAAFQAKIPPKYEAPQKIRPGGFRNVKYMSELILKFHRRLKEGK